MDDPTTCFSALRADDPPKADQSHHIRRWEERECGGIKAGGGMMTALVKKKINVQNEQGLHARPAVLFVQLANRFNSNITVRKGRRESSGKSIMGILTLGVGKGSQVEITCDGEDAEKACRALEKLLMKELE